MGCSSGISSRAISSSPAAHDEELARVAIGVKVVHLGPSGDLLEHSERLVVCNVLAAQLWVVVESRGKTLQRVLGRTKGACG